jgi:hypothetical protein
MELSPQSTSTLAFSGQTNAFLTYRKRPYCLLCKVVVPSPQTLSWDACSMTHLETHSPMHLK